MSKAVLFNGNGASKTVSFTGDNMAKAQLAVGHMPEDSVGTPENPVVEVALTPEIMAMDAFRVISLALQPLLFHDRAAAIRVLNAVSVLWKLGFTSNFDGPEE